MPSSYRHLLRTEFGSIHDLDHVPEAPDVATLTLDERSSPTPPSSPKSIRNFRRSLSPPEITAPVSHASHASHASHSVPSHALPPPPLHIHKESNEESSARRRSDTAPGRLDHIVESEQSEHSDLPSTSVSPRIDLRRYNTSGLSEFEGYHEEQDDYVDPPHHDFSAELEPNTNHDSNRFLAKVFHLPIHGHCFPCDISRIFVCLVRHAPCFWFCGRYLDVGATDRSILYRVNILSAFFAFGQVVAASLLLVLISSNRIVERYKSVVSRTSTSGTISLDLWNLNGSVSFLGVLGAVILITAIITLKVVREVNLRGAVRYLWTLLWLLPLQIFVVISLFDYHRVTQVWVRHWWYLPSMAWLRQVFCATDTFNTLCVVPIGGDQNYTSEEEWCTKLFNATNCTEIRDSAQANASTNMYIFYYSCGIWGICLAILLILAIRFLEVIITKDIVQKSRESNVPGWMFLPIVGCLTVGSVFLFSPSSAIRGSTESTNSQWVGVLYIIAGACFFVSALLGWFLGQFSILNALDKRNKNIAVICFIGINIVITALLAAVFAGSVLVSTDLVDVQLSDANRGRGACAIDTADSCSYCGNRIGIPECPEWTQDEVIKVLLTQYKSSAAFAAIFILYSISAIRFGVILKQHISRHQIDYV